MPNVYGFHPVKHLLAAYPHYVEQLYIAKSHLEPRWQDLIQQAEAARAVIHYVDKKQLTQQFNQEHHQGIVAVCSHLPEYQEGDLANFLQVSPKPLLLVLDGVQDPHNLGACLRTANAAGVDAVIAPKKRAVGLTSTVRKVAAGAAEMTPFIQVTNLARTLRWLQQQGIWLIGTSDKAEQNLYQADLSSAVALVMGTEGKGLRQLTQSHCDQLVQIPMQGTVSSLNVSVATGVCLFEICRQQKV